MCAVATRSALSASSQRTAFQCIGTHKQLGRAFAQFCSALAG
jgi:hypothetical protein